MKRASMQHRREVLARERELAAELFAPVSEAERCEIRQRLAAMDRAREAGQPEPQLDLPLSVAA
jgi:hypothetical protein